MTKKYSDNNIPQIDLGNYLPEVYRSDINNTLNDMVFNRHLTKDDTTQVVGYVGKGSNTAVISRQIQETSFTSQNTAHRQAYQLAPTMYSKVGTVETALSFNNFLTQLELMGVDRDRLPLWANATNFNWIPPVNIDMMVNYRDYFWIGDNAGDTPQYFTIENVCNKATDRVVAYEQLMNQRGVQYPIITVDFSGNSFEIVGKLDNVFYVGFNFSTGVATTPELTNRNWTTVSFSYNTTTQTTTVVVMEPIAPSIPPVSPSVGSWYYDSGTSTLYVWDGVQWSVFTDPISAQLVLPALFPILSIDFAANTFRVSGKQDDLFTNTFVFGTSDTTNENLLNKFWTTASSTYDSGTNETSILVVEPIATEGATLPISPGSFVGEWFFLNTTNVLYAWDGAAWTATSTIITANISLTAMLTVYQSQLNCLCNHQTGWDIGQWDDNNGLSLAAWNANFVVGGQFAHPTEAAWITANGAPSYLAMWYDTTMDQLKQYGDPNNLFPSSPGFTPTWLVVASNFSAVLAKTTNNEKWDYTEGCNAPDLNQWSEQNKWVHKTAVTSFSTAKRAKLPILEYDSRIEMNEWTQVQRTWKYRSLADTTFSSTSSAPSRFELEPIKGYYADNTSGVWNLYLFDKQAQMNANIDYTDIFVPGYRFKIVDDNNNIAVYTVLSSEFRNMSTSLIANVVGNYMATVVVLVENTFANSTTGGGIYNSRIIPVLTSQGDTWQGYHVHWTLDKTTVTQVPARHRQQHIFLEADRNIAGTIEAVSGNPGYAGFTPQVGEIILGDFYQEFTVDMTGISTVDLVAGLQYNALVPTPYALPGSNELRVYINGVRQYGTYTETTTTVSVPLTAVGDAISSSYTFDYVSSIIFDSTIVLDIGDVVKIEVGPASFSDMGNYNVPVRTIEDDADFTAAVATFDQPEFLSLTEYELNEQKKVSVNQYPLFNVFNILTGELELASPIFYYVEDPEAPINSNVQRRILSATNGVEFKFHQDLVESENGMLYAYRQRSADVGSFWYSSLTGKVLYWDGYAWTDKAIVTANTGIVTRTPIVSAVDPESTQDYALWLNTNDEKLYRRNTSTNPDTWVEITSLVVEDIDPTLQTIWQRDVGSYTYTPQYVDKDRQPIAVGSLNGDWGVVDQWIYNPEHKNKQEVLYSQIITHFKSVLSEQPPTQGLLGGGTYSNLQSEYDYSVGGTIHEYNGAFDTLISAVNVNNTTPPAVIEFASQEYAASIRYIRDIFNRSIISLYSSYSAASLLDFTDYMIDYVITAYEENDSFQRYFGDTTAYDDTTDIGVKNWIATAPMFGLSPAIVPYTINDGNGLIQVIHHDGHRTNVSYTSGEEDAFARQIILQPDPRVSGQTLGKSGNSIPPQDETTFLTTFGGTIPRTGVFWYETGGSTRVFYRFEAYSIGEVHPSFYVNGVEIADGTMYYNTLTHNTFVKNGLSWDIATPIGSNDLSPLWAEIHFEELLSAIYLELETRLYARCQGVTSVFDYSSLTPNAEEQAVYDALYQKRFETYISNFSIQTPYVNTQYRQTDAFSWNYLTSTILTVPSPSVSPDPAACWQQIYTNWYGTPYPHLEPWILQGYAGKPSWWDTEYLSTSPSRRWIFTYAPAGSVLGSGMWENIRAGVVPAGRTYPNGMVSTGNPIADGQSLNTYNYFPVNINDVAVGGYPPDGLLPPYFTGGDAWNHSIFSSLNQISAPDADYVFGNGSVVEWQWTVSSQYPYDKLVIAFLMQPVRFLRAAWGAPYAQSNQLEVDTMFGQVYSHLITLFHGDIVNTNEIYRAYGLNQWYVNYNRFAGFDTSDNFRNHWVGWTPLLTYQCNGIVDTSTIQVSNNNFEIFNQDYNIILAKDGAIKDLWVDAFYISLLNIPPAIIQYNNQGKWKMELNSPSLVNRTISYYDVKAYPFSVNATTNVCTIFQYKIISGGTVSTANRFYVEGEVTNIFEPGVQFVVSGTGVNDGSYNVVSSVYEPGSNQTRINVSQTIVGTPTTGTINVDNFDVPWETGDMVVFSSTYMLPAPLTPNTPYYIIKGTGQNFQVAETFNNALTNVPIDFISVGTGLHTVAEISSSFLVMGGDGYSKETWYHYALDKTKIRTFTPPHIINGIQNLINLIDGHATFQVDNGVSGNSVDINDFDPVTARPVTWALECERFINWAYGLRSARLTVSERFALTPNTSDSTLTFVDSVPYWPNGTAVQFSSTGTLPAPLTKYDTYYVYNTNTPGMIQLSVSPTLNSAPFNIVLTSVGTGILYGSTAKSLQHSPIFEMNPTRNNIWINTPEGFLADIIQGPYSDIRIKQTIFDQYGRAIPAARLLTYRQDKRSRIAILPEIPNDVDKFFINDPYNYIHLGGGHFFIEGYEHFLLFNPYTVGGVLVYDSFLGLNTTKFELDFYKKPTQTLRPTLGGYYMLGHQFYRNIEGSATDLKNFYDLHAGAASTKNIKLSRALLGYSGDKEYMDQINVASKAQFMFYRGMLHAKGSVNSVLAYINSRRFVDAKLDEVWAYKLAEFGDTRARVYPEILLYPDDGLVNDVRLYFLGLTDDNEDPVVTEAINEKGFSLVSFADDGRWNNFPEQQAKIGQPLFLDAELDTTRVFSSTVPPIKSNITSIDYWYNSTTRTLHQWDGVNWDTIVHNKIYVVDPTSPGGQTHVFWRHDIPCDDVRVVQHKVNNVSISVDIVSGFSFNSTLTIPTYETSNLISNGFSVSGNLTNYIYSGTPIVISGGTANDGNYTAFSSLYQQLENVTYIVVAESVPADSTGGTLTYTYPDLNFYDTFHFDVGDTGLTQYTKVNSEAVRMDSLAFDGVMLISTVRPAYNKINPAKLVNRTTDATVNQVTLWHPAYGWHYYQALHNIDFVQDHDPAKYSISQDSNYVAPNFWNSVEVGNVWFDTSSVGYVPYYDDIINPDINTRLYSWGNLAPYASINVYQWVRSTVPPSEWDALALSQQGDITIDPSVRVSGTARTVLYRRDRATTTGTITIGTPATITTNGILFENGQKIFLTSDVELFDGVTTQEDYLIENLVTNTTTNTQTFNILDAITDIAVDIVGAPIPVEVVNVGSAATEIFQLQIAAGSVIEGDYIQLSIISGGILPTTDVAIAVGTNYVVTNLVDVPDTGYQTFGIKKTDNTPITIQGAGVGNLTVTNTVKNVTVVPHFDNYSFIKQTTAKQRIIGAWLLGWDVESAVEPTIKWSVPSDDTTWVAGDSVEVYINGVYAFSTTLTYNTISDMFEVSTTNMGITIRSIDLIDVVRPLHTPTPDEQTFDPGTEDDGTVLTQWKFDYEYSESTTLVGTTPTTVYHFWVQNSVVDEATDPNDMSMLQVAQSLETMPDSYFIVQRPLDSSPFIAGYGYDQPPFGTIWSMGEVPSVFLDAIPIMYREAIIRNISTYIGDNTKHMIQFTRDLALRNTTEYRDNEIDLKEIHSEWILFRQNQSNNIPQLLWDKVVEALSGVSLTDGSPVPSQDRVLYDAANNTDTQYGLGVGQTFVNKELGLSTLLNYLQDPEHDFSPINIDDFFVRNDFTTTAGITAALQEIYDTFGAANVNGIWFALLQDALTLKAKYEDLFKTSWVALHGIQILDIGGLFDD